MVAQEMNRKHPQEEFTDFWNQFRLLPWNWAEKITGRFGYFVVSILGAYAVLGFFTFFPQSGAAPLVDYPSLNLIFLGATVVGILVLSQCRSAPSIFRWLWDDQRLETKKRLNEAEFESYMRQYQKALQANTWPLVLGVSLISGVCIFLVVVGDLPQFLSENYTLGSRLLIYLAYSIGLFWAFIVCLVGWAFLVTSAYIGNLTKRFKIKIQPSHPDRCGGLKPLGDYCLRLAIPLIVAGLVCAIISVSSWDKSRAPAQMATIALFLLGPFTAITVFVPMWDIHVYMSQQKRMYQDEFATQAMELEQTIRSHSSDAGNLKDAETAKQKLEILQAIHPDRFSYPVWPFRFTNTVLAIFSPQILQTAIGFILFIYETFFKR